MHRQITGKLVIATHNPGKLAEMRELLAPHGVEARADGTLVWPPRGTAGFGYDPMFMPDGFERTFGEMTSVEKHGLPPLGLGLSHRARAFVKLAEICLEPR